MFFVDDAVVVPNGEFAFAKLDVPLDAMEQFLERLHVASFMMRRNRCWCIQLRAAVFSGSGIVALVPQSHFHLTLKASRLVGTWSAANFGSG